MPGWQRLSLDGSLIAYLVLLGCMGVVQKQKVDYLGLPQPCRYEDSQREVMSKCF